MLVRVCLSSHGFIGTDRMRFAPDSMGLRRATEKGATKWQEGECDGYGTHRSSFT